MSDRLLPQNATPAELALEQATARVGAVPTPPRSMWNADTCPEPLLPWLAWAFSLDGWNPAWDEIQKRESIKQAVSIHRYKGTIGAVREAIGSLGIAASVEEWFAQFPVGDEYTFRLLLSVDQFGIDLDALSRLVDLVDSTKNLRSHLSEIVIAITSNSEVYIGGFPLMGHEITINYEAP